MHGPAFTLALRRLAYRAWQDRRGNTDYDVEAVDGGDFRQWWLNILSETAADPGDLDPEGVCLTAWRYSNHRWGDLDDAGFEAWWARQVIPFA